MKRLFLLVLWLIPGLYVVGCEKTPSEPAESPQAQTPAEPSKPTGSDPTCVGPITDGTPEKIKMPPRSKQKDMVSAFTPKDVTPPKTTEPTREYTARDLPGITSEDLHLAALMILRRKGLSPNLGESSSTGPEQLSLPLGEPATPIQKKEETVLSPF